MIFYFVIDRIYVKLYFKYKIKNLYRRGVIEDKKFIKELKRAIAEKLAIIIFLVLTFSVVLFSLTYLLLSSQNYRLYKTKLTYIDAVYNQSLLNYHKNILNVVTNDKLIYNIQRKNIVELVRWLSEISTLNNIDGALLLNKRWQILAKNDFLNLNKKTLKKYKRIIKIGLDGKYYFEIKRVSLEDLDEGLKFKLSQELGKEKYQSEKPIKYVYMIFKTFPIYNNASEIVATLITVNFITTKSEIVKNIEFLEQFSSISIIDNSGDILSLKTFSNKFNYKKFKAKLSQTLKKLKENGKYKNISYIDDETGLIFLPLKNVNSQTIGYIVVELSITFEKKTLLEIVVIYGLFFVVVLGFIISLYKYINNDIFYPLNRISAFIEQLASGDYRLPVITPKEKNSKFIELFNYLYKIAHILKKYKEPSEGGGS